MKLLFIGAGKMATAMAAGLQKKQLWPADQMAAVEIVPEARQKFTEQTGVRCVAEAAAELASADVILLAVKPQVAEAVAKGLQPLPAQAMVLSICAGITLAKLSLWFGTGRVVRIMPNTPLMVGKGASAYALGKDAGQREAAVTEQLLGALGIVRKVQEEQLDAVTAVSGSGPAYVFEMAKAMAEAGEKAGLSQELALTLTVQTLAGAAEMMAAKLGTPDELRDAVTSPNGTTAAALETMRKGNFRQLIEDTVMAAKKRSQELGR